MTLPTITSTQTLVVYHHQRPLSQRVSFETPMHDCCWALKNRVCLLPTHTRARIIAPPRAPYPAHTPRSIDRTAPHRTQTPIRSSRTTRLRTSRVRRIIAPLCKVTHYTALHPNRTATQHSAPTYTALDRAKPLHYPDHSTARSSAQSKLIVPHRHIAFHSERGWRVMERRGGRKRGWIRKKRGRYIRIVHCIATGAQVPPPESSAAAPPAAPATSAAAHAAPTARPRVVRTRPLAAGGAVQ